MTQMRVQITTPYGVTTRDFADYERDVLTTAGGVTLATFNVVNTLLAQAEVVTHDQQLDPLIGYDTSDEHAITVATVRTILGRRSIEIRPISEQDPSFYDMPEGVDFSEVDAYELDNLPFEVIVEDITGQLYDEYKDRVDA